MRKINHAFCFDIGMWMQAGIAIDSLCRTAKGKCRYNIYCIVDDTVDGVKQELIRKEVEKYPEKHNIEFINFNSPVMHQTYFKDSPFPPSAMLRLYLPYLLPKLDKVIYTDVDVLFIKNTIELDRIKIGDNYIGAVRDYAINSVIETFQKHGQSDFDHYPEYGLDKMARELKYINSGVLIMNLKLWRREKHTEKLLKIFYDGPGFRFCDQDTLNIGCAGKIMYLPLRFNRITKLLGPQLEEISRRYGQDTEQLRKDFYDYTIMHFVAQKPWDFGDHMTDVWWTYAKNTHFYDILLRAQLNKLSKKIKK